MMIDALLDEKAALEAGLASDFWRTFKAHCDKEWSATGQRYQSAIEKAAAKEDEQGMAYLRMTIFAKKEIDALFAYPEQRLAAIRQQLLAHATEGSGSRRGPGL